MAMQDQEVQQSETQAESSSSSTEHRMERTPAPSSPVRRESYATGPFSLMRRFSEDMDRLFSGFFGRDLLRSANWADPLAGSGTWGDMSVWPEIEVHQAGNKIVVQADVPGLKKDEISVEVRQGELCISGERSNKTERDEGRYYRSERSYGKFCRTIQLPEGAKLDTASATFDNGVLKIEMEAPSGQSEGRKLEVREGSAH
jgi:HSP20 family protein